MKYLNKSFSVGTENSAAYRDNYDRIFGKKSKPEKQPAFERCHECGSWEAQCSAPGPVPGCACARCLRAALEAAELRDRFNYERAEKAERERDEARASEKDTWANWESRVAALKEQTQEAKADAARLREAMRESVRKCDGGCKLDGYCCEACRPLRKALKGGVE